MKNKLFALAIVLLTALVSSVALTACNTMKGVGQDVESAGDAIKDSAQEHKRY